MRGRKDRDAAGPRSVRFAGMKATDLLRAMLSSADDSMKFIEAMRSHPLMRCNDRGNHAWWTLGHLVVTEGRVHKILLGEANPAEHLKDYFDWGSTPCDDSRHYPPFDELLTLYCELRAKTVSVVNGLDDAGLDRPVALPPPGLEAAFKTFGQTLTTLASHQTFHCGEVAAYRRASGGKPFFVPSEALKAF